MTKQIIIKIERCEDCPHKDHTGGFTKGGPKPCCHHPNVVESRGHNCFNRVIPYKDEYVPRLEREARLTIKIPDWCPL